jgi:hypothetical protein
MLDLSKHDVESMWTLAKTREFDLPIGVAFQTDANTKHSWTLQHINMMLSLRHQNPLVVAGVVSNGVASWYQLSDGLDVARALVGEILPENCFEKCKNVYLEQRMPAYVWNEVALRSGCQTMSMYINILTHTGINI